MSGRIIHYPDNSITLYKPSIILLRLILIASLFSLSPTFSLKSALAVDAPQPLTPADGAIITAVSESGAVTAPPVAIPEFTWTAVQGATSYRLQISQDVGFTTKIEFTTPHTRYTPALVSQFNDGLWYWRVRVEAPIAGPYSNPYSFTRDWASPNNRPLLTSPSAGEQLEFYAQPTFSWQPVMGAASYRFQISTSEGFTTLSYNVTTPGTSHQPSTKLANGTYYWRVIPLDAAGREGTYSETRVFNQGYSQVPTLLEPLNNSTPTFTPTFRWTAVDGASSYRLQYSTDPTFPNTSVTTTIDTKNTTYTPTSPFPNDVNYYWRVRTHSGNSISDWSQVWTFIKRWYIQPVLLTPTNNYQNVRFPFFSWTPVPGASYYILELDAQPDFIQPDYQTLTSSNPFLTPQTYYGTPRIYYWRVTPYDKSNNKGKTSAVFSYRSSGSETAPSLIYPLYYYPPNTFPPPDQMVAMQPHEDRTVPYPIFIWHRVTSPPSAPPDPPGGGLYAPAYRLQVSRDPLFLTTDWSVDTENTWAAPTTANPFTPLLNTDYYWRVCALDGVGGNCLANSTSQVWRARLNPALGIPATSGNAPQLLRPARASEHVETTPLFQWKPLTGADSYEIQISRDPSFTTVDDSATTPYPVYAPTSVLAQRDRLNRLNYGTYYWRVRALSGGNPLGTWSSPWRFQVASQSQWQRSRSPGNAQNYLIASDPDDISDDNYELTTLYATQDLNYWYFGFNATTSAENNMTYALYLDTDHQDNSGATSDPRGYTLSTIPAHRPEFAIYIFQISASFSAADVAIYGWNGSAWNTPQTLEAIGGSLYQNGNYVEIRVPNTAIGSGDPTKGSFALSLVSLPFTSGSPVDSVPSDPNVPGSGLLSRFTSVSERMMLVMPPTNIEGDPTTYPSMPPLFWEYPTGSNGVTPWAGCKAEVNLDPQFTGTTVATYDLTSDTAYYASTNHPWDKDFIGNNTYYIRIRPRYKTSVIDFGVWSESIRIERQGFTPQNLRESVIFATPTFTWDLTEGAESYDLQVDNDPNFGSAEINTNTSQNTYTPPGTLANGLYYWRVRARRYGGIMNEWSQVKTFTLALPKPTGLSPNDPAGVNVVGKAPTFCWNPLLALDQSGIPVLAAYKYRVQVSRGDPTFSTIYDSIDTEQTCWTPTKGYDDGKYYWRVAMMDGQGRLGEYSAPAEFTKQYPTTTLIKPLNGQIVPSTPTFEWSPVQGAALYKLEVSQYPTFSPIYDSVTTNNTRFTPTKVYQDGKTYYWHVAIIDKDGKLGPFNDATIILNSTQKLFLPMVVR